MKMGNERRIEAVGEVFIKNDKVYTMSSYLIR